MIFGRPTATPPPYEPAPSIDQPSVDGGELVRVTGGEACSTTAQFARGGDTRWKQPRSTGDLTRYELKYLLHPAQVPLVRAFIAGWCKPDANAKGDPPSYINTTLLFDTPDRACYRARCTNALSRFKLRARVYATDGSSPVILEIKRKLGHNIIKSRAKIPFDRSSSSRPALRRWCCCAIAASRGSAPSMTTRV
jgi:hypothetical protein